MHIIYAKIEYMDIIEGIKIFRRVSEAKSFSVVAKELGVTQPTISKTIQSLEAELELVLFRRSTRGLNLTVEGEKLYNSGGGLIDHFERVLSEVKSQKLNLTGEIRIGASLAFARIVLTPVLGDFANKHPDLRLSFILSDGYTDLIEQNIDVAIRIGELRDSTLRAVKIGVMHRSLYVSKKYLKKYGRPKSINDLHNHRLLFYTRLNEKPQWAFHDKKGITTPFYFEPYLKSDGSDLMRESVLEGLGIALLPTWMMQTPEFEKVVEKLFDENALVSSNVYAITPPGRDLTSKQRAVIDFLRQKFEKISSLTAR